MYLLENNTCEEVGIEIVYAVTALKGDNDSLENVRAYTADINCKSICGLSDSSIVASKG